MSIDRRDFLKSTLAGAALATIGAGVPAIGNAMTQKSDKPKKRKAQLNLSFQEGIAIGDSLEEKLDYMESLGIVGLEPGGGNLAKRVNEFQQALRNRKVKISAICAGFQGFILAEDTATREKCKNSMKEILAAAGELGSTGVILVPAFNHQKPAYPHTMDTRKFLIEQMTELGDFAAQHNTKVIFEPLNRGEAFYLRQVGDAASICRDANCPGLSCMGDFWHMTFEENSDMGAFISAGDYLQHVHVASRKRRSMPGEDGEADNYIDGFKGLKMLGYDKYVSFECGSQGDRKETIPAAVKLLREQWKKA